jgi:hypothetical protein
VLGEEPERKQSPSLSPGLWNTVLTRNGFSGLDVRMRDCEDDKKYVIDVMISTAASDKVDPPSEPVFIICAQPEQLPHGWLDQLFHEIRSETSLQPVLDSIETVRADGDLCIFFDNVSDSILASPDRRDFECIKRLVTGARGLLWISHGATLDCENPMSALHAGFLRTLRCEYANKRYISLDLEHHNGRPFTSQASNVIARVLGSSFNFTQATNTVDFEYALRNDSVLIPRICVDNEKSKAVSEVKSLTSELKPFYEPGHECRLVATTPGMLDSLTKSLWPQLSRCDGSHGPASNERHGLRMQRNCDQDRS